jgi:hypothetical protein
MSIALIFMALVLVGAAQAAKWELAELPTSLAATMKAK